MKNTTVHSSALLGACFKRAGLWALLCLCATVQAQPTQQEMLEVAADRSQSIQVLGNAHGGRQSVSPAQIRVVFVRPEGADKLNGSVGLFVNDRFHTSLVVGGYTDICLPPQKLDVGVRQIKVGERAKDPLDTVQDLDLQGGQTVYLRIAEVRGRAVLLPVNEAQVLEQLASLRLQVQAVSRVPGAAPCVLQAAPAAPPTPALVAVTDTIVLAADALFEFGRSDTLGLTASGFTAIDQLMQRVRNEYSRVDRVHVVGHADPLGSPVSNQRLSEERASLFHFYVARRLGLGPTTPISSEGRGSRDPVITTCGRTPNAQSISCNQPNRRVEVEVTGLRR
jgi:OmpA-OmpF porin, OOP family